MSPSFVSTECSVVNRWMADVDSLAQDRPSATREILQTNDFYGHATILKEFAGIPATEPLHLSIEHGPALEYTVWEHDFHRDFTVALVVAKWRAESVQFPVRKKVVPIGPYIHYARPISTPEEISACRERLGRTLLVFPMHSTHHVNVRYDVPGFAQRIHEVGKNYDSVVVCLYWKDVLRGVARSYQELGFPCITAGHIYDPAFLRRLRTYLEIADASMSNAVGSHLGYSVYLGKPHYLMQQACAFEGVDAKLLAEVGTCLEEARYNELFSSLSLAVTAEQQAFVGRYWGFDDLKSAAEIRQLAAEGAQLFKRSWPRRVLTRLTSPLARYISR